MFDIDVQLDRRVKLWTRRIIGRINITQATYKTWPCGLAKEIIILSRSSKIRIYIEDEIKIFVDDILIVSSKNPKGSEILNVIELAK